MTSLVAPLGLVLATTWALTTGLALAEPPVVATARAAAARCTVVSLTLARLVARSEVIVVARVRDVSGAPGDEIATATVEEAWKGSPGPEVRFRANPSRHGRSSHGCDISEAERGERALLFLSAVDEQVGHRHIEHLGRGRMPQLGDGCEPTDSVNAQGIEVPGLPARRRDTEGVWVTHGVPYAVMATLVRRALEEQSEAGVAALREELLAMHAEHRTREFERAPPPIGVTTITPRVAATAAHHIARLKEIVDTHDWPGRELVGEAASNAAFELVQQADSDTSFQWRMRWRLSAAARRNEAPALHAAMLTDRLLITEGLPQTYGTQYAVRVDGGGHLTHLLPEVEDIDRLDERRAEAGLGPWIEDERRMARSQGREPAERPLSARR